VAVLEERYEVVFAFEPDSYRWGQAISISSLALMTDVFALALGAKK